MEGRVIMYRMKVKSLFACF